MARVINPLFSQSASGKFAGLIYQTSRYGQTVKGHVLQRGKPTVKQKNQNFLFGTASDNWRLLTPEEQQVYKNRARGTKLTGFNLYIKENIGDAVQSTYGSAKYGTGKYI